MQSLWNMLGGLQLTTRVVARLAAQDLFLYCARHCRDVVLDEEGVEDDERQRADQRASHQRAPAVDITVNQRGHNRDRHGLVLH